MSLKDWELTFSLMINFNAKKFIYLNARFIQPEKCSLNLTSVNISFFFNN